MRRNCGTFQMQIPHLFQKVKQQEWFNLPSSIAAQGRVGNTEDLTEFKKEAKERGKQSSVRTRVLGCASCQEEPNPSRNSGFMPQSRMHTGLHPRHCKETGTVIMVFIPWQVTKASGHATNPTGKGGNRKARNTSHTSQEEDLLVEEEHGCPGCTPTRSGQGSSSCSTSVLGPGEVTGQGEPGQDSEEPAAHRQSRPAAFPTPGLCCSSGHQGAETTKGAFQAKAPRLQRQHSAWAMTAKSWLRSPTSPVVFHARELQKGAVFSHRLSIPRAALHMHTECLFLEVHGDAWAQDKGRQGHKA